MAMKQPQIIAHRGGAYVWPENSLFAFRQSLMLPVEVLECDVHPSSDGVPMVHHDATLERMTDLTGPLVARSAAELGAARFRGAPGETIPTLAALARLLAPSDKLLRVEVKGDRDYKPYPGFLPHVLGVLEAEGMLHRSVIIAFHGGTAAAAAQEKRLAGAIWLVNSPILASLGPDACMAAARALGVTGCECSMGDVTPAFIAAARKAGLTTGVWAANHRAEIEQALDLGMDAFATDDPPLAIELRKARG
jgi:glycerophosphoryl diester phosphodiesterase